MKINFFKIVWKSIFGLQKENLKTKNKNKNLKKENFKKKIIKKFEFEKI